MKSRIRTCGNCPYEDYDEAQCNVKPCGEFGPMQLTLSNQDISHLLGFKGCLVTFSKVVECYSRKSRINSIPRFRIFLIGKYIKWFVTCHAVKTKLLLPAKTYYVYFVGYQCIVHIPRTHSSIVQTQVPPLSKKQLMHGQSDSS